MNEDLKKLVSNAQGATEGARIQEVLLTIAYDIREMLKEKNIEQPLKVEAPIAMAMSIEETPNVAIEEKPTPKKRSRKKVGDK